MMTPAHHILPGVVAEMIRRQPLSPAKVTFAWRAAAGAAVARATRVDLREDGVLLVFIADVRWRREIEPALGMLRTKLATLLGDAVRWIEVRDAGHS
jgi:predicted nucleic acid-binding Zn ribbon protein